MAVLLALALSCGGDARVPVDAGAETSDANTSVRQCQGLSELKPVCDCTPGQQCFAVSDGYEVCSAANQQEATSCAGAPGPAFVDHCGCNGATCPPGESCRQIHETVSGGSFDQNRCFAACQNDADCSGQQICLPNRFQVPTCITPECSSDADCSEDDCGHCVRERWMGFQGALWGNAPRCVYEGQLDASSCRGSGFLETGSPYPYYPPGVHTCHAWVLDESER
jgi:hypothetical protein